MHVHVCLIASSIKIITKYDVAEYTDSSQQEWFHVETYMHVLGLWFSNTANAKISSMCWPPMHAEIFYATMENLSAAHAFDYIVFRINLGLTSYKDLAVVVDNSLENN